MYFLLNTVDRDPFGNIGGASGGERAGFQPISYTIQLESALKEAFNPQRIIKYFLTVEEDAKRLNTQIGNGLTTNLKQFQDTINEVYAKGLEYGFLYGDSKEYMAEIGASLGRSVNYQRDLLVDGIALGKAMGITNKEAAGIGTSFIKAGFSAKEANEQTKDLFNQARLYGVNAAALTKTVSSNIYLAQGYGFKDGVKGLTEMAAQAQRLGLSFDGLTKTAEMFFDIDKAVEMSSKLQMLGGNFGFSSSPSKLS